MKDIDYSMGLLKLPEFGTYTIYWTIINRTEIESKQVRFTITEPKKDLVVVYDPDVTIEQIAAAFNAIDKDDNKNLSLGELLMFYFDSNLMGGLKAGLTRLINQVDKNRDNQINYVEIYGAEQKVTAFVPAT